MMIGTKLLNSFYVDNDLWEYWKGHIIIRTITRKITSKITKYGYFYRKSTDPCVRNNIHRDGTIIVVDYLSDEWAYIGLGFCQSTSKPDDVVILDNNRDWI